MAVSRKNSLVHHVTDDSHFPGFIVRHGQRNLNVYERASLALQRPHCRPRNAVYRVGITTRLLNSVLGWFCAFNRSTKYR